MSFKITIFSINLLFLKNFKKMASRHNFDIILKTSDPINCSVFFERENGRSPLLIFSHGFKGFKDWGGFPYLYHKLSEAGFAILSFNFTHNGVERSSPMDFTRLDLFAENTHTIELNDINRVIHHVNEIADDYNIDKEKIGLIGH